MTEPVILKSNKYGISLVLDPNISFEDLITAICKKFANSRSFFGKTSLILEIKGRDVSAEETAVIIEAIELNSDITVVLMSENNELKDTRMKDSIDKFYVDEYMENAKIIRGSIIKNEVMESDSSLLILGDVKSKAKVQAKGNIIIMGSLEGEAYAGFPDNTEAYIVAGDLRAKSVTIGGINKELKVNNKWFSRTRSDNGTMCVRVFHGDLLTEPLASGLLKKKDK